MPKCKPNTVYIYEVLTNNGGIDKNEFGRKEKNDVRDDRKDK